MKKGVKKSKSLKKLKVIENLNKKVIAINIILICIVLTLIFINGYLFLRITGKSIISINSDLHDHYLPGERLNGSLVMQIQPGEVISKDSLINIILELSRDGSIIESKNISFEEFLTGQLTPVMITKSEEVCSNVSSGSTEVCENITVTNIIENCTEFLNENNDTIMKCVNESVYSIITNCSQVIIPESINCTTKEINEYVFNQTGTYSRDINDFLNFSFSESGEYKLVVRIDSLGVVDERIIEVVGDNRRIEVMNGGCFGGMSGTGTVADPCIVTNCSQLQNMSLNLSASYALGNDIDCSSTSTWNGGAGFIPVGDNSNFFIGTLNGANYIISNLYINNLSGDGIGLFGYTSGNISNLGLVNVNISGRNNVGSLAGESTRIIINSYSTGTVKIPAGVGPASVGGLVGTIWGMQGMILNCYSKVNVTGTVNVGGIVGMNYYGIINNSYSTGNISGVPNGGFMYGMLVAGFVGQSTGDIFNSFSTASVTTGSFSVGGFCGQNDGTITNSYWYNRSEELNCYDGGNDGCTANNSISSFYGYGSNNLYLNSWNNSIWSFNFGNYPTLKSFNSGCSDTAMFGSGSVDDPYMITNCCQLQAMQNNLTASYALGNDINCSETRTWNEGAGFIPVGDNSNNFLGNFDGRNHTITNLYIYNESLRYVGLFGLISGGNISNVGMYNESITALYFIGGLAGQINSCIISNSFTTGIISAHNGDSIGGLVGMDYGNITNSYSTANISGQSAGGLVGHIYMKHNISNSYSSGNVTGGNGVGGLAGENQQSTISNSFSSGRIYGSPYVGGLIGSNPFFTGIIINSYWYNQSNNLSCWKNTTGAYNLGCIAILDINYFKGVVLNNAPFSSWDFTNTWKQVANDYPHLRWENINEIGSCYNGACGTAIDNNGVVYQCGTINASGSYSLNQSINSSGICLNISTDNIVVDGNGNNLSAATGIYAFSVFNLTIKNITLSISINNITNSSFLNNNFSYLNFNYSNNNNFINNSFITNTFIGGNLFITNSNHNIFFNNRLYIGTFQTGSGFSFTNINYSTIINNYFEGSSVQRGVYLIYLNFGSSINNTFFNNSFNVTGRGEPFYIHYESSINDSIINNTFSSPVSPIKEAIVVDYSYIRNMILDQNIYLSGNEYKAGTNVFLTETKIKSYTFNISFSSGNIFEDLRYGLINFYSALNGTGSNLIGNSTSDIQIGYNFVYVNSSKSGLNKSANITFYNISTNFVKPVIFRDSQYICNDTTTPSCHNFTSLNADNVIFNVSSWSKNFSIVEIGVNINSQINMNKAGTISGDTRRGENISINATLTGNTQGSNVIVKVWQGAVGTSSVIWQGAMTLISGIWNAIVPTSWQWNLGSINYTVYANNSYDASSNLSSVFNIVEETNLSFCRDLDTSGSYYVLLNNVYSSGTCFNITTDNIILNCNGNSINFNTGETGAMGILITGTRRNITIVNCIINETSGSGGENHGIFMDSPYSFNNSNLSGNTIIIRSAGSNDDAIHIDSKSNNNSIFNNNLNANTGIFIGERSTNDIISNNTITANIRIDIGTASNITFLSQNLTSSYFRNSGNVTLTNLGNYVYPYVIRNGTSCVSTGSCSAVTSLGSGNYYFRIKGSGNFSIAEAQEIHTINAGWNLISLGGNVSGSGDRNISLVAGNNLIGYSSIGSVKIDNINFTAYNQRNNLSIAAQKSWISPYFSYLDSTSSNTKDRKFKYATISTYKMDSDNVSYGKGYWVYVNYAGNITLPNVGGAPLGWNYSWSKLRFSNGTIELNITDADNAGWIYPTLQYWGCNRALWGLQCDSNPNRWGYMIISDDSVALNAWQGYFIKGLIENVTLIRQD